MFEDKDYSQLPLEELLKVRKDLKKWEIINALLLGFLAGVVIYGVAKNGLGFLHIFLPAVLIFGIYKSSRRLKSKLERVQAEIDAQKTA